MKVLIWEGNPVGVYGRENRRRMLRVWVDNDHKVHVEPITPEFKEMAQIVQADIDRRLADPHGNITHMTGGSRRLPDGTWESMTKFVSSTPDKEDFLEVLRSDRSLIAAKKGVGIAGYELRDAASEIIEE